MNTLKTSATLRAEAWSSVLIKNVSVSLQNLQVLLKLLQKILINSFATHTDNNQMKVLDSSSSRNELYLTFVIDNVTSNLVRISDRHKIKSAP